MKTIAFLLTLGFGLNQVALAQRVALHGAGSSPQMVYATGLLKKALLKKGYSVGEKQARFAIDLRINVDKLGPEAYSIRRRGNTILLEGGDERGLIYGSFSLAEDVANGVKIDRIDTRSEGPHLPFRAVKFNLPWDTYRHSQALDLHGETCRDPRFWEAFLDMMAENRFNALTLWNLHPFSFMIKPKNFLEANSFSNQEMADWRRLYQTIFRLAKERGIDTYIVNWNIFVSSELAEARNVTTDNVQHDIKGKGDTSAIVKRYTREAVTQVLEEYPDLTGIGFTHGEAMGGMTPQERQDWFGETILEGMRRAKRKSKLIHRIPLSANLGMGGSTNVTTEQLTRKAMEGLDFLDGPIWAEIKFNWSHAYSSPKLVKVHGGKIAETYFKPAPTNYKIAWMARNEDFFCLRWGVPSFIREHIATNTPAYVGGYFVGSECYIPAKDYFTKPGTPVGWTYAFERQWLFYKLWGRLLYNPATPDGVFKAEFTRRYGPAAAPLLEASALAGTTPLRLASAFDFTWDFTLYSEGMMALDANNDVAYISVDRLIAQPPTDPDYVSVRAYVKTQTAGGTFDQTKITPLRLAQMLEQDGRKALELVKPIPTTTNRSLRYEVADVQTWANLGLHFAEKLKGAVALQTYRSTGDEAARQTAVNHLEAALGYWDAVIAITQPLYNEMPLVHYSEKNDSLRFHWKNLRPAVARDIDTAKKATFVPDK